MADTLTLLNAADVQFVKNTPLFIAAQTAVQSIPTNVFTALTWPTPSVDTYTGWAAGSPTRYTAKVSGYYLITASYGAAINGTGSRAVEIRKNGVTPSGNQTGVANAGVFNTVIQVTSTLFLSAAGTPDYVEAYVDQSSGGNLNTVVAFTSFTAQWVHA